MAKSNRCIFRELETEHLLEINPLAVRMLRKLDMGTEVVFSETHSVKVKAGHLAVSKAFQGKGAWNGDDAEG